MKLAKLFKSIFFYRTSRVVACESFRFPVCNFIKNKIPAKIFFYEFGKTFKSIFSFDRTPTDYCFLCFSVNFEKFFRTLLLQSTSRKLLFLYCSTYNLTAPISPVLIDQHLIICSLTSPTCYNSPPKFTPVKYKTRQKAGFPVVTKTTSFMYKLQSFNHQIQ